MSSTLIVSHNGSHWFRSRMEKNTSLQKIQEFLEKKWFGHVPKDIKIQLSLFADPKAWCSTIGQFEGGLSETPLSEKLLLTDVFAGYNLEEPSKAYLYYDIKAVEVPSFHINEASNPILPGGLDEGVITNFTNFSMMQGCDTKLHNFDSKNGYDSFGTARINLFANTMNSDWNMSRNNFNQSFYLNDKSQMNNNLYLSQNNPLVSPSVFSVKKSLTQLTQTLPGGMGTQGPGSSRQFSQVNGRQSVGFDTSDHSSIDPGFHSRKKMDFSMVNVNSQHSIDRKSSYAGKFSKKNGQPQSINDDKEDFLDPNRLIGKNCSNKSDPSQPLLGKHESGYRLTRSTEEKTNGHGLETHGNSNSGEQIEGKTGLSFRSLSQKLRSDSSLKGDGSNAAADSIGSHVSDSLRTGSFVKHPIHEKKIQQINDILQEGDKFESK